MSDLSIYIVGAAGEGIQTIGDVVSHAFLQMGIRVFTTKDYESRIRGGNSSYRIRANGPNAPRHSADVILSLNAHVAEHYSDAAEATCLRLGELSPDGEGSAIPFQALAKEHFDLPIYANAIAAGALGAVLGIPSDILSGVLRTRFSKLSAEALDRNLSALEIGMRAVADHPGLSDSLEPSDESHLLAGVHEVIPLAAAAVGCRFMAAYPMSPATGIMTAFAKDPELGVFVVQAEDEIAAINVSLGASAAGARAMTATSGGGFALMTEGVSLAGMTETPLVIVIAQRPGPATGLPTRTAQEDLNFAIYGGHGEFPRAVLAPSDPQEAVDLTRRAFDLAERFQMPVILLTDQFLADSHFSLQDLMIPKAAIASGLADPASIEAYQRYAFTEDGVSPRLALGQSDHLVRIDSDEHTEDGHITEDLAVTRPAMVEKRLEKLRRLQREMKLPTPYRTEDAETVLLSWGSTRGAVHEAVDRLRDQGERVGALHVAELWPLPTLTLPNSSSYWSVEGNATGQFSRLIETEWNLQLAGKIERYDGIPIDANAIIRALGTPHEEVDS